jgi:hypothetical protein
MRLSMISLTASAVALALAFAPGAQAAINASPASLAQADKAVHSIAQKKMKPKKSAAYKRAHKTTSKGEPKSR